MSFSQAHDFSVGTYSYTNVSGDAYHYNLPPTVDPLTIIRNASAVEATHASKTASYAPKCRPGSRAKVTHDIMEWTTTDDTEGKPRRGEQANGVPTPLLWFQGPAGGGKTCIMREVVSRCEAMGYTVASYFFSTRVPGLDSEEPFVATIALQFAAGRLQQRILQALSDVPNIFDQPLERQARCLLVQPLLSDSSRGKIVVVLDGLDECREARGQREGVRVHLISILHTLATSIPGLRVIVASRPEFDIRTAFASPRYAPLTHMLRLQDYDGTSEIRDYLCDEFCRIRETHPAKDSIDPTWPAESTLDILVDKSSGSYIYPSTVVKYISNPRRNPVALLEVVLALRTSSTNPLADLDGLYDHILHPPDMNVPLLRRILHCIMTLGRHKKSGHKLGLYDATIVHLTPEFLDEFLSLPTGTTVITLCDIHSLISVPSKDDAKGDLQFHHKSLEDYLQDKRSRGLHQPTLQSHADIISICISHLTSWSEALPSSKKAAAWPSPARVCSLRIWTTHLRPLRNKLRLGDISILSLNNFDPTILWNIELAALYHCWSFGPGLVFPIMAHIAQELHQICTSHSCFRNKTKCLDVCTRASQLRTLDELFRSYRQDLESSLGSRYKREELHDIIARLKDEVSTRLAAGHPEAVGPPRPPVPALSKAQVSMSRTTLPNPSVRKASDHASTKQSSRPVSQSRKQRLAPRSNGGQEIPRQRDNRQLATMKAASSNMGGHPVEEAIIPPRKSAHRQEISRQPPANGQQATRATGPSRNGLRGEEVPIPPRKSATATPTTGTRGSEGRSRKPTRGWRP